MDMVEFPFAAIAALKGRMTYYLQPGNSSQFEAYKIGFETAQRSGDVIDIHPKEEEGTRKGEPLGAVQRSIGPEGFGAEMGCIRKISILEFFWSSEAAANDHDNSGAGA